MRDLGQKRAEMQMWTSVRFLPKNWYENAHLCMYAPCILVNLGHPNTPAARGLEELFSDVLERFLKPIHALRVYCKD
jgi:hypothetical protein